MGGGSFSMNSYRAVSQDLSNKRRDEIFAKSANHKFKVNKEMVRECVASEEHPRPVPFVIGLDVTGSMGVLAETLAKRGLGNVMEKILASDNIHDAQLMFAAIGDGYCDDHPLQVTQFESDNRMLEQLTALHLEGGGGGNDYESYSALYSFVLNHVHSSHTKLGYKGMIITIGDEPTDNYNGVDELKDCGIRTGDLPRREGNQHQIDTRQVVSQLLEHYDIFHILVNRNFQNAMPSWHQLLGKRVLQMDREDDHATVIPELIVALYELQNMQNPGQAKEILGRYSSRVRNIIVAAVDGLE